MILEQDKILMPSQYRLVKNSHHSFEQSGHPYRWASSTVAKILHQQEYCGDVVNLKTYSNSFKDKTRRQNSRKNMVILRDVHIPIVERPLWEYIQCKLNNRKARRKSGKQSLFSGFLRCRDCGSNLHYHFNQVNPSIEYYNCSNYVGNRGTCPDTHYIRLDDLQPRVLSELNRLIRLAKGKGFWSRVAYQKSVESSKQISALTEKIKCISNRLREIAGFPTKVYEDKLKGVIDDETFVLLISGFKKERERLRSQSQQVQEKLEAAQKFLSGLGYFKEMVEAQQEIEILTRQILGQFIDWIAVYPADRSVKPYRQKIEIHYQFLGVIQME